MTSAKFIFSFALLLLVGVQFSFAQYNSQVFADGELLIKYKDGTDSLSARSVNAATGATVLEEFPDLGWQRVKISENLSVNQALSVYKSNKEVEAAQPNFYYHLLNTSNDSLFSDLYGLQRISAPAAWDLSTGSATTVVANIDTGILYNHEDLAANMWHNPGEIPNNGIDDDSNGFTDDYYGYDFFYNDSNPIDDAGGHGTHTSGIIGAAGNNSVGIVGVNWNVQLMAIKIYSPSTSDSTSAMLINAYNYIRMMKNRGVNIRVTNNSYGGCGEACGYDQATKDALDALGDAGVLQVFAAGNSGQDVEPNPFYPASYTSPSLLTVAASDFNDNRAGFSNYGANSIDLAAPGSGILSTFNSTQSSYVNKSGTSMAAPQVTGAAALLASYNPSLSAASLKATLMNSVDVLPQWNGVVKTGGRLNVARALQNPTVCTYTLDRSTQNVPAAGGTYMVSVTAPPNCDYSIVGTAAVQILSGNVGSGNGTITFKVLPSVSPSSHVESFTIAGQQFAVNQAGSNSCSYSLSETGANFSSSGGGGTVIVKTQPGCSLTVTSNNSFITAGEAGSGFENGIVSFTVSYTIEANAGAARTGNITISGQTFTVTQSAFKSKKRVRFL